MMMDFPSGGVRYLGAFTLLIGLILSPKLAPSHVDTVKKSTDTNASIAHRVNDTDMALESTTAVATMRNSSVLSITCKVPNVMNARTCGNDMGKVLRQGRPKLAEGLPLNPRAHLFHFHPKVYNHQGERPILCVPQKNGNRQFGGLVYAAWNKKPATSGEQVTSVMSRFEHHTLKPPTGKHPQHVYFIARNPYARILSLYLQKVMNACISTGQKGCTTGGWKGMHANKTSFPHFVRQVAKKVKEKGSVCRYNVHLCQQVSSCLAPTLEAKQVTILRLEEQSCWFPCLVQELSISPFLLQHGWNDFSGSPCYYTATGNCHDMLTYIDPLNITTMATGNVHATGASNKLLQYYTAESADIVSRLYQQDFDILGYPYGIHH